MATAPPAASGPSTEPDNQAATGRLYILHGDDELGLAEEVSRLRSRLGGEPAMADLNTSVLDGRQLTMGELRHVCSSIPFLHDRRLVIVHGLLTRLATQGTGKEQDSAREAEPAWKSAFVQEMLEYLPSLPPATRLVFVEHGKLDQKHRILAFALKRGRSLGAYIKAFEAPADEGLPAWIQDRARGRGGVVQRQAALLLAGLIGKDLRLLDLEIDKLLTYADGQPVTTRDVQLLVSRARETSIWDLVDSLGRGKTDRALRLLHGLLDDGEEPLYVLAMLARQVRILMQVRELLHQHVAESEIARRVELRPFVARKAVAQVDALTIDWLQAAHERLVETDWAIKTGQLDDVLALDLLVEALSGA